MEVVRNFSKFQQGIKIKQSSDMTLWNIYINEVLDTLSLLPQHSIYNIKNFDFSAVFSIL